MIPCRLHRTNVLRSSFVAILRIADNPEVGTIDSTSPFIATDPVKLLSLSIFERPSLRITFGLPVIRTTDADEADNAYEESHSTPCLLRQSHRKKEGCLSLGVS
jgi:hypothetical protein